MNNFNKIGIAAAVATALGSLGSAQALTLADPGEALLVPFAVCDDDARVNTLIGITTPGWLGTDPTRIGKTLGRAGAFSTAPNASGDRDARDLDDKDDADKTTPRIHWYFFDKYSVHQSNNKLPASKDDFIPFDWCNWVRNGASNQMGKQGYIVFTRERGVSTNRAARFGMFGDAALIQGDWESAGWLPVLPMADGNQATSASDLRACVDEVFYGIGGIPKASPLCAGIALDDDDGSVEPIGQTINLRYFLDPALNGATDFIFWTDKNCRGAAKPSDGCNRTGIPVLVYDTEEDAGSAIIPLPYELNVFDPSNLDWTQHENEETFLNDKINVTLVNQGFVQITLPEIADRDGPRSERGPENAAVAMSLIHFSSNGNESQVQTALAQEIGFEDDGPSGDVD